MPPSDSRPRAIVTGGGTGLGQASTKALLAAGFDVLSLGLDVEEEIDAPGYEHRSFDVTDSAAIAAVGAEFDRIDVLVNAAGIILHDNREMTNEGFAKVMQVNLTGTQQMCFACETALGRVNGSVINFASMWTIFGSRGNPSYSASKGAVASLTRSLAVAWGPKGIRVNAVAPGWVATRMATRAMNDPDRAGPILARIPMGRWGDPAEVGAVVAFLASPAASYVTGAMLPIDGGYAVA
ncbi:2-dehydro-3-deoxy-D-gluconate 5-dehydrogenase (plasmid) [Paracoccaceae bacterium]|nr:2-dehydro-3-deoxy-D-gluconate 5-dehydrogenase [Paracoccaceae bacterium]